jgi:hypothetical protein
MRWFSIFPLCSILVSDLAFAQMQAVPPDVAAFVSSRNQCDHFRGEEPYDVKRNAELAIRLKQYCTGTDATLRKLRIKYSNSKRILRLLSSYEEIVE